MVTNPPPPCAQCQLTHNDPRLRVVIDLLSSTFLQPVRICELARLARMKPTQLARLCKDSLGMGPKRLQTILRVGHTLSDLIVADNQVKHMAGDAGLPVVETFIRNFEKVCGLPPNEFRHLVNAAEAETESQTVKSPPA